MLRSAGSSSNFLWRGDELEHRRLIDHYHPEITAIVIADDGRAGWLAVSWHSDRVEIESIYLLAEYQSRRRFHESYGIR